jgi:hypothetical protein
MAAAKTKNAIEESMWLRPFREEPESYHVFRNGS